jgi:hypothetical protein
MLQCAALALALAAPGLRAQANLVPNGNMELDEDGDAVPDCWQVAGDANTVSQRLRGDRGVEGERSVCLECTRCITENPASHAMVCQVGRIGIRSGDWYLLSFQAKQQGLRGLPLMVALVNTADWSTMGLSGAVIAGTDWERHELLFQATGDARDGMRLQFCFLAAGTLWLDDVRLVPTDARLRPALVWPDAGGRNLLPNGGFECGTEAWGSVGRYVTQGWSMPLNRLYGDVVPEGAAEGRACFRVTMGPGSTPVCFFDCMAPVRTPVRALLCGNHGWLSTTPGRDYCLSASLRADRPDTPAKLVVQPFAQPAIERDISVGTSWQRYEFAVTCPAEWSSVLLGPDLTKADRQDCVLWIDAVQFEPGSAASEFTPRARLELGLSSRRRGNVFYEGDPAAVEATVSNQTAEAVPLTLTVTDFDDRVVTTQTVAIPSGAAPHVRVMDLGLNQRGFYRVRAHLDGQEQPRTLRLAIIPRYRRADSLFGVNHAYPWDHLLQECRDAGLLWVRDWSLKWHDVQPQPGPFDFTETDYQVNRSFAQGHPLLGLLPFPSSNWSSSASAAVAAGEGYPALGGRTAYAPRSDTEFSAYVRATVEQYRDRIRWWQVFNEPLYTNHALPHEYGYSGRDYGRLVMLFSQAARSADPGCRILAGIGGWPDGTQRFVREMFESGALAYIDAVDVHTYPGLAPPETLEAGLRVLRVLMREAGGVKPIWLTEHGYYADDDFEAQPVQRVQGWNAPLPDERRQAVYSMRFNVILLANGVERIFYHAGTCPGLNSDNTEGTFFEYDGAPRKIYPAVAAFAELFAPGCKALGELDWGPHLKAYLFETGNSLVVAAWRLPEAPPTKVEWDDTRIAVRDLMGNSLGIQAVDLGDAPVFFTAHGVLPQAFGQALRRVTP